MDKETCLTCRFSRPKPDCATVLICKRNPPQVVFNEDESGYTYIWPNVDEDQWCGCWAPFKVDHESKA